VVTADLEVEADLLGRDGVADQVFGPLCSVISV
jgi:hypothetical protein